jgi:pimeloyl-ACP methyl ester carboxylesterase
MASDKNPNGSYADVNGIHLYYEIFGSGEPLILLHGGLGAIEMFGEMLNELATVRKVIAVDLQGHGRTADVDRPIRLETSAEDIAALIKHLGIKKTDVMGFSMGASVALWLAIQHPDVVRNLIVISAPYSRNGWYPELRAAQETVSGAMAEAMKPTPMYELYSALAPRVEDWSRLLDKMGDLMKHDYDWSADVAKIKSPTLLVFGDADGVSPAHAVKFFELLGGGQRDGGWDGSGISSARLSILPGVTHYNILDSPALMPVLLQFLSAPS